MGARKLRHWVLHPLRDLDALTQRQDMIAAFLDEPMLLSQVRTLLKEVRDLERTSSRLSQGSGNGRDLQALAVSLEVVPILKRCSGFWSQTGRPLMLTLGGTDTLRPQSLFSRLHDLTPLCQEIQRAICR
jgi:DNA mismatch repair protein MutS